MSTSAAQMLGHPPGLNFRPDDDELIEFFLLPRARGQPVWFSGVVVLEDDTAANTLPWNLLKRHGMADDNEAYFFVHCNNAKEVARKDRYCDGGATWVSQRPVSGGACIGGEMIKWRKINLNLHMGRGKSSGGSTGWVMHEYTITEPPCPSLKICRVTFSGHGKDRKRVPDDVCDYQAGSQPASKRARVDAAASRGSSNCAHGSTAPAVDQAYGGAEPEHAPGDEAGDQNFADVFPAPSYLANRGDLVTNFDRIDVFPAPSYLANRGDLVTDFDRMMKGLNDVVKPQQMVQEIGEPRWCYPGIISVPDGYGGCPIDEGIAATAHQQQMPLPDAINDTSSATCGYGSRTTTVADQDSGAVLASADQQEPGQATDEETLEFWRSIGVDTDNIFF